MESISKWLLDADTAKMDGYLKGKERTLIPLEIVANNFAANPLPCHFIPSVLNIRSTQRSIQLKKRTILKVVEVVLYFSFYKPKKTDVTVCHGRMQLGVV